MPTKQRKDSIYPLRNPSSCTRCPYNETGGPCIDCPNTQLSNSGKCWISLDALPTGLQPRPAASFTDSRSSSDTVTDLPPDTEDYLRKILSTFASLSSDEMLLVHGMLKSQPTREIADLFGGLTKQAVSARIRQAVERHPFLASLAEAYRRGPKTHSFCHIARAR